MAKYYKKLSFVHENDKDAWRITWTLFTQLIPRNIFLLQNLIISQLVKKFPAFYRIRIFVMEIRRARQRPEEPSPHPHTLFKIYLTDCNVIVPSMPVQSTIKWFTMLWEIWMLYILACCYSDGVAKYRAKSPYFSLSLPVRHPQQTCVTTRDIY
jgi:hypothetical protein